MSKLEHHPDSWRAAAPIDATVTGAPAVSLVGVSRRYGQQMAVEGIDLDLHAGECVGLVGHNGAGKSTLIKLILGLVEPTAGRIAVLGHAPTSAAAANVRRTLGYLPESLSLSPALTGEETLAFYARLKRQPLAANPALLDRVGLGAAAKRPVGTYSKGMRQRLGLAQAMLGNPRLLLFDEPTSGLDPELRLHFYAIVDELRRAGAMVLLSSHALAELEGHVDRVVVMHRGHKVADGSIATLRALSSVRPRIRLRPPMQPALDWAGWHEVVGGLLETTCDEERLTAVLRSLPPGTREIEIIRPSLDDLYASFQKEAP